MSKLGTVEVSDRIKAGMKHYERLEGVRKADKLVEEATQAYLKVITTVIEKDQAILAELGHEKSLPLRERYTKAMGERPQEAGQPTPKRVA